MCLVMKKCSLKQSLSHGTGHLSPEPAYSSFCGNLSDRRGMSYHLWISWNSSGLKPLTDLGQREGKQQRDEERQEQTTAMQRTEAEKNRARWWQAGRMRPGEQRRRDSEQGSAVTSQQNARPHCCQTQTLAIINTKPTEGNKQSHRSATTHSQLRNKERSLPQGRRTAWSPKPVPSSWFCYNPALFMCASSRAWGPRSLGGSGALRCWMLPQATGMAMLFPRWSPCLPERPWGWMYTPLDMMFLLAGTSLSLGRSVAVVVLRLPIHRLEGLYSGVALVQGSLERREDVQP